MTVSAKSAVVAVALGLCTAQSAHAGAWTLPKGGVQTISGITISSAARAYDSTGHAAQKVHYNKLLTQTYIEYGLRKYVTLFAVPEYARARFGTAGGPVESASALAVAAGARVRIMNDRHGVLSVAGSYKSAGAFDTSVSVNRESGRQFELRLLYGQNFDVFGLSAFADIELGERWIAGARPNETPIDATFGVHAARGTRVLIQTFNVIAGGDARPPYSYYRSHKLALSLVQHVYDGYSLQFGGFFSPAGQSALKESGLFLSLWDRF
jgi:hypothetical protein